MARSGRPPKIDPIKAIHRAVMDNDVSTFSVELADGANINTPGPEDMTPLHIAADRGNVEFAKALLDRGATVDPVNVFGNTPLWVAIMKQSRTCPDGSMIRLLLDHGADPNRTEGKNAPLVMIRRIAGFPEDLIELIEQKAKGT
ncbi:ankyrin repeat domain-containing protein [Mycobacterium frederiksbergense]|uniref:ankyrin repeat domain-containing protein n=1 Tax=Mycolicibacterium frederiksbergense TaxID=117567 RepID=UPI0021F3AEBC|nr:ankyrin repeat domain-containing protein [Mycolicibacterium frederiksbergense]MCV7043209.1 ankyrin repeat domain-containing protein [Mycolicibacterium frederiksbergense]